MSSVPESSPPDAVVRLIRALPKAELHVHLEGSIRPELAMAIAQRRGVTLPGTEDGVEGLRRRYRYRSFREFLELYVAISACLQQAEDFRDIAVDLARTMEAQKIRYAEVTVTPMTHVVRGVDFDRVAAGLFEGRAEARRAHGVELRWVFDIVRCFGDQARPTLELALRERERGVIGLGLGGPESPKWPYDPFEPVFAEGRAEGLRSVPHAGEHDGPDSVRQAIERLGAERIGHGVRCLDDPALVELIRERGVALEVCPSSNVALGVAPSLAEHPLPRLLDAGVKVSLGSDDPPMFGTTLVQEYERCAAAFGWSSERVVEMAAAAVRHGFMAEDDRQALLEQQREVVAGLP